MTRLLCLSVAFAFLISCKPEYKKCEIKTNDSYLKAYNDILNEIIIKRGYNRYLGKDEEQIFERYASNISDSYNIDKDVIRLHNKLFKDTTRFCTLYLDTSLKPTFNSWVYFQKDTNSFSLKVRNFINGFSDNSQAVIDSLNSLQTKYSPQDFTLCTANIKSLKESKIEDPKCYIGRIAFSKLILNRTKDKGILYYEFRCGGLCGYGELVTIEKNQTYWEIKQSLMTWIS